MTIERCSPVEMRKNLEVVETLKSNGLDFVAIPVSSKFTKEVLISMTESSFCQLEKDAE